MTFQIVLNANCDDNRAGACTSCVRQIRPWGDRHQPLTGTGPPLSSKVPITPFVKSRKLIHFFVAEFPFSSILMLDINAVEMNSAEDLVPGFPRMHTISKLLTEAYCHPGASVPCIDDATLSHRHQEAGLEQLSAAGCTEARHHKSNRTVQLGKDDLLEAGCFHCGACDNHQRSLYLFC